MAGDLAEHVRTSVRAVTGATDRIAIAAALNGIDPLDLEQFFHLRLVGDESREQLGVGLPASPGAASGRIVLNTDAAMAAADAGIDVILVRSETTPDDVPGMQVARGILTARGGLASHAAVVARGWGIPAVVGVADLHIDHERVTIGHHVLHDGDEITIDGDTGRIYVGVLAAAVSEPPDELNTLLAWADAVADGHVQVRANADTAADARLARRLGAKGIGLCRTEHMFLDSDRLPIVRRFILAHDQTTESDALAELEAAQVRDFEQLLEAMDTLPVTVRLLDPPLHEFLPDLAGLAVKEARDELTDHERLELDGARRLHESNPMIGTRGVRLGIVRNGLYQMQVRALCSAAARLFARSKRPHVEIMIPLVVDAEELRIARGWVHEVLREIGHPELSVSTVTVGAMIETPRAALTASALADHADFFSFGTNDLTQMTYAFSRDDVESTLLPAYLALGILPANPFAVLDQDGVGELVRIGCDGARRAKPGIKIGSCGEHAGHPESAAFLVRLGIDSVSCSPFRVPMARLAVAQALLACGRVAIDDVDFEPDAAVTIDADDPATAAAAPLARPASPEHRGDHEPPVDHASVLHTLRVRGFVTPEGFIASLGEFPAAVVTELVGAEQVRHIEKRNMYGLLPAGRALQETLLDRYADDSVRRDVARHYDDFLELNTEFKQLCTDWQMRSGEANDHTDAEYDRSCVDRLLRLHRASEPLVAELAVALPRLARYSARLADAAECVARGDTKQFTGVMCESFHDIWMEFHEDLIVLQRINRVEEGSF